MRLEESKECGNCGNHSTMEELFQLRKIKGKKSKQHICPGCVIKLDLRQYLLIRYMFAFYLVFAIILYFFKPNSGTTWLTLNIIVYFFASAVSLVLHELGHAISTKLMGGVVPKIIIGTGKKLFKFSINDTVWEIKSFWSIGLTYLAFKSDGELPKYKYGLSILAGPTVNLVIAVAAALVIFYSSSFQNIKTGINIPLIFLVVNVIMFLSSVIPRSIKGPVPFENDGKLLFKIIRNDKETIKKYFRQYYVVYLVELHEKGEFEYGLEVAAEALTHDPDDEYMRNFYAMFLIMNERYDEAIAVCETELSSLSSAPETIENKFLIALTQNNLSYAIYERNDGDAVKSLEFAKMAFQAIPWEPSVLQTYGCALNANNELEEGINMLKKARTFEQSELSLSQGDASLGIAYYSRQEFNKAKECLERAQEIGIEFSELRRLKNMLVVSG